MDVFGERGGAREWERFESSITKDDVGGDWGRKTLAVSNAGFGFKWGGEFIFMQSLVSRDQNLITDFTEMKEEFCLLGVGTWVRSVHCTALPSAQCQVPSAKCQRHRKVLSSACRDS
ncbi:hypothetical protein V6N13_143565 [Hibiscus sabdariffa]|uniref:Uncharacterized protein n=1 Tax=Hibiscus sabdariffa TaxID=183260 RepID=A0ABR2FHW4_9ROSI